MTGTAWFDPRRFVPGWLFLLPLGLSRVSLRIHTRPPFTRESSLAPSEWVLSPKLFTSGWLTKPNLRSLLSFTCIHPVESR